MRFYEIVARGTGPTGQVVSSYWYRDQAAGLPSESDLVKATDVWIKDFEPKLRAFLPEVVTLDEVATYGYRDTWVRTPFLPHTRNRNLGGLRGTGGATLPFLAIIFSALVEPVESSPKKNKLGVNVDRPVRRGYWALGPEVETNVGTDGRWNTGYRDSAHIVNLRDQMAAQLFDAATMVTPLEPIRVGKPREGELRKGYGLIRGVRVRAYASTRRSRMFGKGA